MSIASFGLFPPERCLAFMTLGKDFFGVLLGCTLPFLLVVGLQATGRDSPSKIQAETNNNVTCSTCIFQAILVNYNPSLALAIQCCLVTKILGRNDNVENTEAFHLGPKGG